MTKDILGSVYLLGLVSYLAKFSEKWGLGITPSIAHKALRWPYRGFQAKSDRYYHLEFASPCVSKWAKANYVYGFSYIEVYRYGII